MAEIVEGLYMAKAIKCVAASFCMSVGAMASAMGQGYIGGKFLETAGKNPANHRDLFFGAIACIGFVETSSIFTLLISLILIFF